ncbi:DNA/RNA non-specific endonuclease [Croceivirga radicis]|uniref:DNA/RNA non-specific endonuclease n=1 Tax=Croceivirga radicis TaxID=1929488 RepID=UPI000255B301|nr:DNA/RNA non-specific endonuclease [Croceivirga radicis]
MKRKYFYPSAIAVLTIGFWLFNNFYTPASYSDTNQKPVKNNVNDQYMPSATYGEIVAHNYFTLSYSEPHEQAEWVAYWLKREHLTYEDRKRPYFIEDPKVKTKSADWKNYRGSGYDRGHLCPAGDRRFSLQAYNETFYTSNISPQDRAFNAGIWNRLEQKTRSWCKKYGDLFIVTGGVLENGLAEIGEEDVDVPKMFYKIILRKKGDRFTALAFLMPNKERKEAFQSFIVPIDKVEQVTGIDFFKSMPKETQDQLEANTFVDDWNF